MLRVAGKAGKTASTVGGGESAEVAAWRNDGQEENNEQPRSLAASTLVSPDGKTKAGRQLCCYVVHVAPCTSQGRAITARAVIDEHVSAYQTRSAGKTTLESPH